MTPRQRMTRAVGLRASWVTLGLAACVSLVRAAPETSALPDCFVPEQLLWEVELGTHQYTVPKLDRGRLFIGINDWNLEHPSVKRSGGGVFQCLDAVSGRTIWQLPIPRYLEGTRAPFHFNHWKCGVCSQPAIEDDRLYIVGPRGDLLCLDRNGQADGNDGEFVDELRYMGVAEDADYKLTRADGDILWRYDLIQELGVIPHDVCGSSPLLCGDALYATTGNGHDDTHRRVANPAAPSLIVLDKRSGKLMATDGGLFGERLLHGNWSSPKAAEIEGRTLILFSGGDGVLYAFEAVRGAPAEGPPKILEIVWQYDCNPPDYRERDGQTIPYARWNQKSAEGPSEAIASPVVHQGRVYVSVGQSPVHGPGQGLLSCVDLATGRRVWSSREVDRSLSDVVIHEDLLFAADYSGRLHCFDAATGDLFWQHDLGGGVWTSSPLVVDGKVYVSTEKNKLWTLRASRNKEVLSESHTHSPGITPVSADGVMYYPTQKRLFAVKLGG